MKDLIVWLIVWFLTWIVFNYRFNWNLAKTYAQKYIYTSLFFITSSVVIYVLFGRNVAEHGEKIIVGSIVALSTGIFLSNYYPYYKHIKNGKYFLVSLVFDILFQQIMIVIGISILKKIIGLNYSDLYFGILFMLGHLPVIFFDWAKLRYVYLISTLIGGTLFSYLITNYSYGAAFSLLIHYFVYTIIFYRLRDIRKI